MNKQLPIVTVTLNPALDRTLDLPSFTLGKVNRVEKERTDPGGKGINVAKVITALQHPVLVTGFLGHNNAAAFQDYFHHQGIRDHFVETPGDNRVNIKIVDRSTNLVSELNFPGITPSEADLDKLRSLLRQLAASHKWFVLSGSPPPTVPADIYADFIDMLNRYDCKVLLDSSGPALVAGLAAKPFAVKPNLPELRQLMQTPLESESEVVLAMQELLNRGISQVAVSLGDKGALVGTCRQVLKAKAPAVPVSSTVGAGDAFVAGYSTGQARGLSLIDSIRLATAAAGASVALPGTQAPSPEAIHQLLPQIQIEEWR